MTPDLPPQPSEYAATPVLENQLVRLEPIAAHHEADLAEAVSTGELWKTWYARHIPSPDGIGAEIERLLGLQRAERMAPFAVVDRSVERAVGITTYMNLDAANRRLEIGSTWLSPDVQGTGINPAMKLLMLERAFTDLGCIAVELRTHWHNHQSRAAIARLGAKQDGVLRHHMIFDDGHVRDTVVFSILNTEWQAVRAGLIQRLAKHSRSAH
ncbi:GNAT family N-acetyltransferase [Nesterenkonia alba]|uniref:GNAT family N-acetyltransferase n=1 Tax=Nesterenkonia alba TaxID=515814 RepID=UPI0003B585A1|nr:GNAT family protein [Nesterenkonia alba]